MNRELFQLAVQGIKRKRKSSALLFAVLCLSFCFAVITLSVSGSMARTNEEYRKDTFGEWQGAIPDGLPQDEAYLKDQPWLSELGIVKNLGAIRCDAGQVGVGTADEAFFEIGRIGLQDGHLPENESEIVMEAAALSNLGYDYTLGQALELEVIMPGSTEVPVIRTFTLCGVLKEYTSLWSAALSGWQGELPAALVTEKTAELLRREAEAEMGRIEQEAQAAIDEAKAAGKEADPALSERLGITLKDPVPQYFFTVREGLEPEMRQSVNEYLTSGKNRCKVYENNLAYGASQDVELYTFYSGMIFAVTVLAVLCIYAIQLQRQVRQFALFRSIGIKKSQLRKLVLFETLLLCVPAAALGVALGALGTWTVLKLAVYSGSAPVQTVVPWELLGPFALVWFLGVALARLVILQIALREPLTGRITMGNKKARRWKRAQKVLIGALSILFCAALVFTVMESLPSLKSVENLGKYPSYRISNGATHEKNPPLITRELTTKLEAIPGVKRVRPVGILEAKFTFDGMESNAFASLAKEVNSLQMGTLHGEIPTYEDGLGVRVYAVREEDYEDFLHPKEIGLDVEAFRKGQQVAVSFPQNLDGSFYLNYPIYEEGEDGAYSVSTERRSTTDTGLQAGDAVTLEFFGKEALTVDAASRESLCRIDTTVGAVAPIVTGTGRDVASDYLDSCTFPYVIWCSEDFAKGIFASAEDFPKKRWLVGDYPMKKAAKDFGYTYCEILTDEEARYVSTDAVAAQICEQNRLELTNEREYFSASIQEYVQSLILLFSSGGCLILVLILLLGNTQTMETEQEKKKCGILQVLGMSKRQLHGKILQSAFSRGVLGAIVGWLAFSAYCLFCSYLLYLGQLDGPEELVYSPAKALWITLNRYLNVFGLSSTAVFVLVLTVISVLLTAAITLFSKRRLSADDLMDKLRDEE